MQWQQSELNVFEAILARRSVRSYLDREVDQNTVRTLLEAAVRAPTAVHQEPWAFAVVQNRQRLHDLSDRAKPLIMEKSHRAGHALDSFESPDFNIFYDAGTLIIICARTGGYLVDADCWLAAENLMLAACSMKMGSCVIGSALVVLNRPETKSQLNIPDDYSAVAPVIVGYPRGETPATSRREPLVLVWD
jgi:nitroreductase